VGGACLGGAQTDTTATIAAWNVKGLDEDPITPERAKLIAKAIAYLDAEVVALSEVHPNDAAAWIVRELNLLGASYDPPILLPQGTEVVQNLAILHKKGVRVFEQELIQGSDVPPGFDAVTYQRARRALAARVAVGQFDFLMVVVHLKSSRAEASRNLRSAQAGVIAQYIKDKTIPPGRDKDVLVLGDYNMIPEQDEVNFTALSPTGFLRFVSYDLIGQFSHFHSCQPPKGNLLDGFAVSTPVTEYVRGSVRLFPLDRALGLSCDAYTHDVSDHLPILASFLVVSQ
jgi:endonuclease/exonuclease/phosphatase family metal-dependent hydrolase